MKKSNHKKLLKLLLLLLFISAVLWTFLSPHPVVMPPERVQVKVLQTPSPPPNEPIMSDDMGIGDEKVQDQLTQLPSEPRIKIPHQGKARIAIIIDDVGLDLKGSQRAIMLPGFITLSFMPYATRLREQTHEARDKGHELMLHMPMEPLGHADPGPGALILGLSQEELKQRLDTALASFVGFDGINNHMGSKYTANADAMELVITELKPRHLFFLDSRTSAQTVGEAMARRLGVPTISRDIFLDDEEVLSTIMQQLKQTEHVALRNGYAVAIGHPHAVTLQAIESWIPEAQKQGFILVPVHDLIKPLTDLP